MRINNKFKYADKKDTFTNFGPSESAWTKGTVQPPIKRVIERSVNPRDFIKYGVWEICSDNPRIRRKQGSDNRVV